MVPMNAIEDFGLRIGLQFNPKRVILFGSHAEGRAGVDSDVDLLARAS
jgi:predicted nucleotidyltransferase